MRLCEDCKIVLESDARFCPNCGKKIAEDTENAVGKPELTALLASAKTGGVQPAASITLTKKQMVVIGLSALLLVVLTASVTWFIARPASTQKSRRSSAESVSRKTQIKAPATQPSPVPPTTAVTSAPTTPSAQPIVSTATARTAGESAVKARLVETTTLRGLGVTIDDVIADPRNGTVIVTFSLPYSPAGGLTKAKVLQAAWQIARAACAANVEVRGVALRCVITPGGPETTQIGFVGEISRGTLDALGENPSHDQLDNAFINKWWNPQIK